MIKTNETSRTTVFSRTRLARSLPLAGALLLLGGGCPAIDPLPETTESGSGTTAEAMTDPTGGTTEDTTGGTADETTGGTVDGTTGDETLTGGDTLELTTGEPPEPDPEVVASCENYCAKLISCEELHTDGIPTMEECMLECQYIAVDSGCGDQLVGFNDCFSAKSCEELYNPPEDTQFGDCDDEAEALFACFDIDIDECSEGFSAGGAVDSCEWNYQCEGAPLFEYVCEGDTCTCFTDGAPGKQCPAMGLCEQLDEEWGPAAHACCQWDG